MRLGTLFGLSGMLSFVVQNHTFPRSSASQDCAGVRHALTGLTHLIGVSRFINNLWPTIHPVSPSRDFAAFAADCDAFAAMVAKRYFELTVAAIKAADPNHLILGCRFAYKPSSGVIEAAGRYCDVISFNCYDPEPSGVIDAYAAAEKPCLISEFSFRGIDSGLPNTKGAGPLVATQADRAIGFRRFATAALRHPAIVGYHWFEYADQPAAGRFDGENSNFGTVTIEDQVYEELTQVTASISAEAEDLHAVAHAFA